MGKILTVVQKVSFLSDLDLKNEVSVKISNESLLPVTMMNPCKSDSNPPVYSITAFKGKYNISKLTFENGIKIAKT